jgi:4-diphosphocytidyl-2-C-methyl-D-erythritol kinase
MPVYHAPAKINLRLVVLAREESGYHQIETLFAQLELSDILDIALDSPGIRLAVEGADLGATADNLVFRAATAFFEHTGIAPTARIQLHKHIPAGSGLGGGSSDAATTLLALNDLFERPLKAEDLQRIGWSLGADVAFFLSQSRFAMAWGRGERILPLEPPPDAHVLLVMPATSVQTRSAYSELAEMRRTQSRRAAEALPRVTALREWSEIARIAHNDFESVILARIPAARRALEMLRLSEASIAALTGSGSAVFGVFQNADALTAAQRAVNTAVQDARTIVSRTRFAS